MKLSIQSLARKLSMPLPSVKRQDTAGEGGKKKMTPAPAPAAPLEIPRRELDGPAPIVRVVCGGARSALAMFVRRNTAAVGLFMVSCGVTALSGEKDPVLCFGMFVLLLLGVSLINIGARAE